MTTQTPLPIRYRIPSRLSNRGISCEALRPGDCLRFGSLEVFVLQNSKKLSMIEMSRNVMAVSAGCVVDYIGLASAHVVYRGRGRPRRWLALLPRWLRSRFCPFSRPKA
jgi:hypothetical protein